jgi:hypothetical protein
MLFELSASSFERVGEKRSWRENNVLHGIISRRATKGDSGVHFA